jgi:hypothetical protein
VLKWPAKPRGGAAIGRGFIRLTISDGPRVVSLSPPAAAGKGQGKRPVRLLTSSANGSGNSSMWKSGAEWQRVAGCDRRT